MLINNDTIIKDTDPRIREKSLPVPLPLSDEDRRLLQDMFDYVKESTDPDLAAEKNLRPAVGISAIQVGIRKQLTAVIVPYQDSEGNEKSFEFMLVNPKIISSSVQPAYLDSGEGCLSVESEHEGHVVRSARIKVQAYDALTDQEIVIRARGYLAIVLQHEIDHFSGILFYDRIDREDPFREIEDALVI